MTHLFPVVIGGWNGVEPRAITLFVALELSWSSWVVLWPVRLAEARPLLRCANILHRTFHGGWTALINDGQRYRTGNAIIQASPSQTITSN